MITVNTCLTAQLITQPPKNITLAFGTNATFTCRGNGDVFWEIDETQVRTEQLMQKFALEKVYVPLPTLRVSQLIVTATELNNFTRTIVCFVEPSTVVGSSEESDPVLLLVYSMIAHYQYNNSSVVFSFCQQTTYNNMLVLNNVL